MSPIAPATRQRGPLPRTPGKPTAKRTGAVKSSPTGPREARREAVPLGVLGTDVEIGGESPVPGP
jgi:hypothetical protein